MGINLKVIVNPTVKWTNIGLSACLAAMCSNMQINYAFNVYTHIGSLDSWYEN